MRDFRRRLLFASLVLLFGFIALVIAMVVEHELGRLAGALLALAGVTLQARVVWLLNSGRSRRRER